MCGILQERQHLFPHGLVDDANLLNKRKWEVAFYQKLCLFPTQAVVICKCIMPTPMADNLPIHLVEVFQVIIEQANLNDGMTIGENKWEVSLRNSLRRTNQMSNVRLAVLIRGDIAHVDGVKHG